MPPDDDCADMGSVGEIGGAVARGPADTAAMTQFLAELRDLGTGPAPEPSPELAALLAGAAPLGPTRRRRHRRAVLVSAAVAAAVVASTGVAAARNDLPAPAQRLVSTVVDRLTPFHIGDEPAHPIVPVVPRRSPSSDERASDSPAEQEPGEDTSGSTTARPGEGGASSSNSDAGNTSDSGDAVDGGGDDGGSGD